MKIQRKLYGFELTNLINDKTIGMFPQITSEIIEAAMKLHEIDYLDIGMKVIVFEELV